MNKNLEQNVIGANKVKKELESILPSDRAKAWENYVKKEVDILLNIFLPEAISGNVGIKYVHPVLRDDPKTGEKVFDITKADGVIINILFDFADTVIFKE